MKTTPHCLWRRWIAETPALGGTLALTAFAIGLLAGQGALPSPSSLLVHARIAAGASLAVLALDATLQLLKRRPRQGQRHLARRYLAAPAQLQIIGALPLLLAWLMVPPLLWQLAQMLPVLLVGSADPNLASRASQPHPALTLLLVLACLHFALAPVDHRLRRQFFLALVLSMGLGTAAAHLLINTLASLAPQSATGSPSVHLAAASRTQLAAILLIVPTALATARIAPAAVGIVSALAVIALVLAAPGHMGLAQALIAALVALGWWQIAGIIGAIWDRQIDSSLQPAFRMKTVPAE